LKPIQYKDSVSIATGQRLPPIALTNDWKKSPDEQLMKEPWPDRDDEQQSLMKEHIEIWVGLVVC
jgi:hypothetical protein